MHAEKAAGSIKQPTGGRGGRAIHLARDDLAQKGRCGLIPPSHGNFISTAKLIKRGSPHPPRLTRGHIAPG
jgi:hypothetical protein